MVASKYGAARKTIGFITVVGWVAAVVGFLVALQAMTDLSDLSLNIVSGAVIFFGGITQVVLGSENTAESARCLRAMAPQPPIKNDLVPLEHIDGDDWLSGRDYPER